MRDRDRERQKYTEKKIYRDRKVEIQRYTETKRYRDRDISPRDISDIEIQRQ